MRSLVSPFALFMSIAILVPTGGGRAAPAAAKPNKHATTWPDEAGLYNVAQTDLGATATGSGAPFNKDWPAEGAIGPEAGKVHGAMFGAPLLKGRVDIHLAVPVEIKAIETVGLDYHGTRQPKAIDVFVDGKRVKHADLDDAPGKPVRTTLDVKGQDVGVVVTEEYPIRTTEKGAPGPAYGGWQRIRVLSPANVPALMKQPGSYQAAASPENIAPTHGAIAEGKVEVSGEPRNMGTHPCTLWDQQDIDHYKVMLKSSPELQKQYAALKKAMDLRLTQPPGIPQPRQDAAGNWAHLSDATGGIGKINNALALDIANMGTVYVLSGEEKYGDFGKQLLLAYADAFPHYGVGARAGFSHDPSKVFDQRLSDAIWLIQVARGYDLIYNLPSISPEQRKHIEDDLLKASARFIAANTHMITSPTNWSAIAAASCLVVGYATGDQALIDTAMYGPKGTREQPKGGVMLHFSPACINDDGMWAEGSTGYQFMAMEALVTDAEILWRHGVDMYRYRDGALKQLFDSPLRYAYPNLMTPAVHDGGGGTIVGYEANLWEYGYLRYRDPKYLVVLDQVPTNLAAQYQKWPVSFLYDRDRSQPPPPVEWKSVNFFSVGFGILRLTNEQGTGSLLLEYGPNRSHGHPDKLSIDLFAFGDRFAPDPGSVWYEQPLYRQWYRTTMAHNTLVVDEQDQQMCGATQLVYGPAETMGLQRASTDQAYPGVTMDRSLFYTPDYLADLFGAFGQVPRRMDLSWHFLGELKTPLQLEPYPAPATQPNGYSVLGNVRHATTDQPWTATITAEKGVARFVAAGGTRTQIIVGDGYMRRQRPPTILERRDQTASTVYGNAVDLSNSADGYVRAVSSEGGLEKGYGLLTVQTAKGIDLCFASYRPGTYQAGGLETDAQQALVLRDGAQVRAMYLGGGTRMQLAGAMLQRSEPGLAYIERTAAGGFLVGNPSPKPATLTLRFAPLAGMRAFPLGPQGRRTGPAGAESPDAAGSFALTLPPASRVELAPPGAPSSFDFHQQTLLKRQQEREAAATRIRDEAAARSQARVREAAAHPAPANTVLVVPAEAFTAQGGGEVKIDEKKTAALGKAFSNWNGIDHWLEWAIDAPADGYYNLSACYCVQQEDAQREILINGQLQEPQAPLVLPTTGGWSNGADDWQLHPATDPDTGRPLLLKLRKGKNVVRMVNSDGHAANLNYLVISSPDVAPTRQLAAARLPGAPQP